MVLVAAAGGGYLYIQDLNSKIRTSKLHEDPTVHVAAPKPDRNGQTAVNILMIGSDTRDTSQDCSIGGSCDGSLPHADVEMLVHLSADRSNISVLSIPRDTQAQIANCDGHKGSWTLITDSLNYGPGCTVDTVEKLTGISIQHYMMIDFGGVVNMTNAIGGVSVCTRENVMDPKGSHLVLPAGTHTIQGLQALEWLRTRHAFGDGTDIGRTAAQHLYLNSLIRSFQSLNTLANPLKLNRLANAAAGALTVDPQLKSVTALSSLALELIKVPAKNVTTVTMPFTYVPNPANPLADFVETNSASTQIFQMIANDIPLTAVSTKSTAPTASASATPSTAAVDRATVQVAVQNESGTLNRGQAITDFLHSKGFADATRDTQDVPAGPTVLTYPSADKAQAQAVAAALGLTAGQLKASSSASRLDLLVGTDWTSGTDYASTLPKAGVLPSAAATLTQNAGTDSSQCMDVNPAPYTEFRPGQTGYLYSWTGSTPP